jgi:hypothetical protein
MNPGSIFVEALLLSFLWIPSLGRSAQTDHNAYLHDDSDWWSNLRASDSDESINTQEREIAGLNLRILGIGLTEKMFERAAEKLGKAAIVDRGDASSGRSQACYVSDGDEGKVHLIFEQGEVEFGFYLFANGPDWYGSERCVPSKLISRSLSTASGLHLGQTPVQVMAILVKPSILRKNELIYSLHAKKKTSEADIKKLRKLYPSLSDKEFHESWDYYDLGVGVVAKFADSKLTYLSISETETN